VKALYVCTNPPIHRLCCVRLQASGLAGSVGTSGNGEDGYDSGDADDAEGEAGVFSGQLHTMLAKRNVATGFFPPGVRFRPMHALLFAQTRW
jgi:hypothetical protein